MFDFRILFKKSFLSRYIWDNTFIHFINSLYTNHKHPVITEIIVQGKFLSFYQVKSVYLFFCGSLIFLIRI